MSLRYLVYCLVFFINICYSQSVFKPDSLTVVADSLHIQGYYIGALSLRELAIKNEKRASEDYLNHLKAKYYHTNSTYFEFLSYNYHDPDAAITKIAREQFLDSALMSAVKARDLYSKIKKPDKKFKYNIQNRIYHQTAYLGNWTHALEQANLGLKILKDTLSPNDKTFVDLIYDIGYIYSQLGDYSKAVENYQTSLDLYQKIIGENHTDVAQAYNNIAVEYRHLGLHKKELESLNKAKNIWEKLNNDDDKRFLYKCYSNLFYWYSYYGDFEKAEEFILRKQKLRSDQIATKSNGFLRNNEEIYEDKLKEWYDLMLHYSRKKDTVKTQFYSHNLIKSIDSEKKLLNFEVSILSSTLKFYAMFIKDQSIEEALELIDKAINIQRTYKKMYFTKEHPFLLDKAELLLEFKKFSEAEHLLAQIDTLKEKKEVLETFKFSVLKAKTNHFLGKNDLAKNHFENAFKFLIDDNTKPEKATYQNLKPLTSFDVIDGILDMGDFYFQLFLENQEKISLKKALQKYFLASEIYNQLYLGERYNDRLYKSYNKINSRLLEASLNDITNQEVLKEVINAIENNGSKLTWSKFLFNNQRQHLDLPEHFINKEEDIKAQLNFYQKALLEENSVSEEKITLWKEKVFEFKNQLANVQEIIKKDHKTYYQFNILKFDIANLQSDLSEGEVILKYIQTENKLYSFLITNQGLEIRPSIDKLEVFNLLKLSLNKLKFRENDYQQSLSKLKNLLLKDLDFKKIEKLTIIPDGPLHYFPFEALILSENMPFVNYASSMLLYKEQKLMGSFSESVKVGAFSSSNKSSKLIKVTDEVKQISEIFEGTLFLNASKDEFLKNANHFDILHLAMHSQINESNPEFSSLNFYGESDNQLFISELYNETFKANMVVLSACDTGNGFYENGEGVICLSRAFNYSGIPSTVMSLWKVDDETTSEIMKYFYKHLNKGETKSEALKNAKLDYLRFTEDDLLKHPYYWSGFVLTGNTEAIVRSNNYLWGFTALILLPLIYYRRKLFQFIKK